MSTSVRPRATKMKKRRANKNEKLKQLTLMPTTDEVHADNDICQQQDNAHCGQKNTLDCKMKVLGKKSEWTKMAKKDTKTTVSIAVPSSILDNCQNKMLATYVVGQIARTAVIFKVEEIVVFDDTGSTSINECNGDEAKSMQSCYSMARILQYIECPQYLRKLLMDYHEDLEFVGVINPLGCSHHFTKDVITSYREGVVMEHHQSGSLVYVGLRKNVFVPEKLELNARVTVQLHDSIFSSVCKSPENRKYLKGKVISSSAPRQKGFYWGYSVRVAQSLGSAILECPFESGYDLTIGTSDKGTSVDDFTIGDNDIRHLLIVFGGLPGLEQSLEADKSLNIEQPKYLFNHYLNTCPSQGCWTIRTEEAVLITLAALRPKLLRLNTR